MQKIGNIGVLTSGGDAPGMNAAIRAVVRAAIYHQCRIFGIRCGYKGLIEDQIEEMFSPSVSNVIQTGGTLLKSARCPEFRQKEGRHKAWENLKKHGIEGLVAIGGDGTFRGAQELSQEYGMPVIGIPATIDNDISGTEYTIGYDTALNTIVEAVDKIRDTASAHNRLFFIEVMGRDAGFLTLRGGIASGAEAVMIPELQNDEEKLRNFLESSYKKAKTSSIVLVAEGDEVGGALRLAEKVQKEYPEYDVRVTILGHIQRGGSPSAFDRVSASRMGVSAVEALLRGEKNVMVGLINGQIALTPLLKSVKEKKQLNRQLLELLDILSI
ncbi:MAG: 6-phosphofructokinase [Candidatus Marinimicrobia bacterium]|jgi:6-phosphofructokinase 1|nr:6-phosphofructokinase [Candidatus Neomarinimicrobiota bacterium]MDD5709559.1 6-phosphofructokinase [Candidatus Neomarinimicrobiota bacterium]MDX9777439.1 6-phosphofructokinase [bacterium]